ncbi:hypothetical protein F5144DRAFT_637181 [Chaetomium tenue]|uniref:Uncharacterized protein n=1 Tax=Chaetomium tenue TaxID=1854479 RepID=A0ACB7PSQ2_9PEZI|nr:hypothetical protein F5144DRAFT_637181 [Chaetomium globosum]
MPFRSKQLLKGRRSEAIMAVPPNDSSAIELAEIPKVQANRRKQRQELGNPGAAKGGAKHDQPQATDKSGGQKKAEQGASMQPSSLPSDNSKLSPREPTCVPEGDIKKQKETKSDDDTDSDLGWELVDNPSAVWARENEAMNKLIDDLDDIFVPSVAGKKKR